MAIDTVQKRKSAGTVAGYWNAPSVIPSGGFDLSDRQHISWGYTGILASAPASTSADTILVHLYVDRGVATTMNIDRARAIHLYVDRGREITLER